MLNWLGSWVIMGWAGSCPCDTVGRIEGTLAELVDTKGGVGMVSEVGAVIGGRLVIVEGGLMLGIGFGLVMAVGVFCMGIGWRLIPGVMVIGGIVLVTAEVLIVGMFGLTLIPVGVAISEVGKLFKGATEVVPASVLLLSTVMLALTLSVLLLVPFTNFLILVLWLMVSNSSVPKMAKNKINIPRMALKAQQFLVQ